MKDMNRLACRTPNATGVTNIPEWKFNAVRRAIMVAIGGAGEEGIAFSELPKAVEKLLPDSDLADLGSVGWHVTTVKLELEVRGEIARVAGKSPQRLFLVQKR